MKQQIGLILGCIFISFSLFAQPQWKFPIAYEDGSGARDTIWYIWDSSATAGIDISLGEGRVQMDLSAFNVFMTDYNPDSTKTHALPFNASTLNNHIRAINYQYPISISWDSSLFSNYFTSGDSQIANAYIQNAYFFDVNNGGPISGTFDMLQDNHCEAPYWGAMNQFPMQILITRLSTTGIEDLYSKKLIVSPNPFSRELKFESNESVEYISIISTDGRIVFEHTFNLHLEIPEVFDMEALPCGFYILACKTTENIWCFKKIIKAVVTK